MSLCRITIFAVFTVLFTLQSTILATFGPPTLSFDHNPNFGDFRTGDLHFLSSPGAEFTDQIRVTTDISKIIASTKAVQDLPLPQTIVFHLELTFRLVQRQGGVDVALPVDTSFDSLFQTNEWIWGSNLAESRDVMAGPDSSVPNKLKVNAMIQVNTCIIFDRACPNPINNPNVLVIQINNVLVPREIPFNLHRLLVEINSLSVALSSGATIVPSLPFDPSLATSPSIPLVPTPTQLAIIEPLCRLEHDTFFTCEFTLRGLDGHFSQMDEFVATIGTSSQFTLFPNRLIAKSIFTPDSVVSPWTPRMEGQSDPTVGCGDAASCAGFLLGPDLTVNTSGNHYTNMIKFSNFGLDSNGLSITTAPIHFEVWYTPTGSLNPIIVKSTIRNSPAFGFVPIAMIPGQQWARQIVSSTFAATIPEGESISIALFSPNEISPRLWVEGCAVDGTAAETQPSSGTVQWIALRPGGIQVSSQTSFSCVVLSPSEQIDIQLTIISKSTFVENSITYEQHQTVFDGRLTQAVVQSVVVSYHGSPIRVREAFIPQLGPNNFLELDVTIPNLCSWGYGDSFFLTQDEDETFMDGAEVTKVSRGIWSCSSMPGGVKCTLRISSPCPWDALRSTDLTHPSTVSSFDPSPLFTTSLTLRLFSQIDISDNKARHFLFSTQSLGEITSTQRDIVHIPPNQMDLHLYSYIPSTLFPANKHWAASSLDEINVPLTHDYSLIVHPLQCFRLNNGTATILSSGDLPLPNCQIPIISPVLRLTNTSPFATFQLDPIPSSFSAAVHEQNPAFSGAFSINQSGDQLPDRQVFEFTPIAFPKPLQYVDTTQIPTFRITFNGDSDGSICGPGANGLPRSCLVAHDLLPTDQFTSYSALGSEFKQSQITLLRATLQVGRLVEPDPKYKSLSGGGRDDISKEIIANRFDTLDQISFQFGSAAAFLTERNIPIRSGLRDKVYVVLRSLGINPHFAVSPTPPTPSFASPPKTQLIEGSAVARPVDNLHCVWTGVIESPQITPFSLRTIKAESPTSATINRYVYGTAPNSWAPTDRANTVLGVYKLPRTVLGIGSIPAGNTIPNLVLTCFTLFNGANYSEMNQYSLEIHGPDEVIRVPFAQRFYHSTDHTVTPLRAIIDTKLAPLSHPRSQTFLSLFEINTASVTPQPSSFHSIQLVVNFRIDSQERYAQLQRGDILEFTLEKLPVWLNLFTVSIVCDDTAVFSRPAVQVITPDPDPDSLRFTSRLVVDSLKDPAVALKWISCSVEILNDPSHRPTRAMHVAPYYPLVTATFIDSRCRFNPQFCSTQVKTFTYSVPMLNTKQTCPPAMFDFSCDTHVTPTPALSTTLDASFPLAFSLPSINHQTESPVTITHVTGATLTLTIPVYHNVQGSAQLSLCSYLAPSTSTDDSVYLTHISRSIPLSPFDSSPAQVTLTLPSHLILRRFFFILRLPVLEDDNSVQYELKTPLFSTIASCYSPPANLASHNSRSQWVTQCSSNAVCSSATQQCECTSGWKGPQCNEAIVRCSQCSQDNVSSCSNDNICQCKAGWGGPNCDLAEKCVEKSQRSCLSPNGYLTTSPNPTECGKTCTCTNEWAGSRCGTCLKQCFNQGQVYRNCDRCGCPSGFGGEFCQCSTVIGQLAFNGYNSAILQHTLLSSPTNSVDTSSEEYFETMANFSNVVDTLTDIINQLLDMKITKMTSTAVLPLSSNQGASGVELSATQLQILISYNCEEFNPGLGREELNDRWAAFSQQLLSNEQIQTLFVFSSNSEPSVVVGDLAPSQQTLPTGDDLLRSAGEGCGGLLWPQVFILFALAVLNH